MAPPKKRREAERELKKKGFTMQPGRGKGSHEVWKNASGESVTVPKHGDEIAVGTWRSIERQTREAQQRAQAQERAQQAAEAQRVANQGVNRAGSGQGQSGSGQQDKTGKKQGRGKSRWSRGRG